MESLEQDLLDTPRMFLGRLCEEMPLDITLYEEKGICTIGRETCEHNRLIGELHLCNKRTYTHLPQLIG